MGIVFGKENDCVSCEHCVNCGRSEGYLVVDSMICDACGDYCEELYDVDGELLCEDCALGLFEKITEEIALAREMEKEGL